MKLRDAVVEAVKRSREPDPHVIARRLYTRLDAEQRRAAALVGVEYLARTEVQNHAVSTGRIGPSRRMLVLRERVFVEGHWKFLSDCTVVDLEWVAADYRERAVALEISAREADTLREELIASGCTTVGEMRGLAAA